MKDEEIRRIVKETVHETLCGLGLAVGEPHEMQADLVYVRRMREGSEFLHRRIKLSLITCLYSSLLYALWEVVKQFKK